ncbi:MAG: hypothetical protein K8F25_08080, partial [Fimbriimonadaceae bacterium]|nr:hypothetical protein [Alphaproteobacteria bacterium]
MAEKHSLGAGAGITADMQVAKIFAWRRGFNAMHLIDLGVRLNLFRTIAENPSARPDQIAEMLKFHPHHVKTWCVTAYSLGLL